MCGLSVIAEFGERGCAMHEGTSQVLLLFKRGSTRAIQSPHDGFCLQAEDGIRDLTVTGVQTCALPISIFFPGTSSRYSPNTVISSPSGLVRSHRYLPPTRASATRLRVRTLSGPHHSFNCAGSEIGRASCRERV